MSSIKDPQLHFPISSSLNPTTHNSHSCYLGQSHYHLLPVSLHPSAHDFLWSIHNTTAKMILLNPEQTMSYLFSKLFSGPHFLAGKAQVQRPAESSRYLCSCTGRSPSVCMTHSLTSVKFSLGTLPTSVISLPYTHTPNRFPCLISSP